MNDMELIKNWRKFNGFSQSEAARILGYANYQSVCNFETGRRNVPNRVKQLIKYQMRASKWEK